MKRWAQFWVAVIACVVGLSTILYAQLWVSSGSGVSTSGTVTITGNTATAGTLYSQGVFAIGGTPPQADNGIVLRPSYAGSGTTQRGLYSNPTFNSSATTSGQAVTAQPATTAAAFTITDLIGLYAIDATKGAGSTITNQYGLKIENQTQGATNYAIHTGTGDVRVGGRVLSAVLQPGFLAYNSANDSNVTTGSTIDFDTEVYDGAGNFSGDTFTAPVTGIYLLCATVKMLDSVGGEMSIIMTTSNRTYRFGDRTLATTAQSLTGCVHADMDANDTATVVLASVVTVDTILGDAAEYPTFFSGRLVP